MGIKDKIGDLCLRSDKSRCHVYWQPTDGPEVFLCSINRSVYNDHPHLRDLFIELATEAMINHKRVAGNGLCIRPREPLPASFRYSPDW